MPGKAMGDEFSSARRYGLGVAGVMQAFTIHRYGGSSEAARAQNVAGRDSSESAIMARVFGPVRGHPLFPIGTVCWFAALFGLSALAVRPDQLEAAMFVAGVDRIVPVIALPLGMAARVLAALGVGLVGGLIGAALGHRWTVPANRAVRRHQGTRLARADSREEDIPPDVAEESGGVAEECRSSSMDALDGALPEPPLIAHPEPVAEAALSGPPPLGKAAEKLLAADITTLSPIALVERLGIAMQCHGPRPAEAAAFSDSPAPVTSILSRSLPSPARIRPEQSGLVPAELQQRSGTA